MLATRYVAAVRPPEVLQKAAQKLASNVTDDATLEKVRAVYYRSRVLNEAMAKAQAQAGDPGSAPALAAQ